ncbi:MAG: hypothetical protein MUF53_10725 [Gemmatimonadaceae bacterium]|nr:hypothetical protein [Gemmatimonadaceae bacterium]
MTRHEEQVHPEFVHRVAAARGEHHDADAPLGVEAQPARESACAAVGAMSSIVER